ncbi:hypothetical protein L7F22_050351 [Adiantum nelumboides]|nr:hypothetical protein [Adiantum nelumboides]
MEGLPTVRSPTGVCEPCQLGKQHRVAFPKQASTRASAPLALVHTDLCAPMSTSYLSGLCYMLVLVDDFSRYTWVSFLKLKSEAFGSIRDWKAMVEKEKDLKVKSIRSNRGGEFLSENFARWCKSEGIRRQLTTPYTPSQNGKNRTIMEMARAMLAHASLPRSYWAEACNTAVYIQNCSPTHALQDMTPFQAYYGRKPTVLHFRIGCSAFVHIPKEKRQKLDFKSRKLLFLGYSAEFDAYRLYDLDTRTTTMSRDVVFDESFITSAEEAAAQPIPILPPPSLPDPPASPVITPSTSHPVPPIQPPDVSPDHALSYFDSDLDVADATPEVDAAPPRREQRIPGWLYSTMAFPNFHGRRGENAGNFLDDLEMAFLVFGREDEEIKLRAFPLVLREEAKVWFQDLDMGKQGNWEALKRAFLLRYNGDNNPEEIWRKLSKLQQASPDSYSEYETQFLKLWTQWENSLPEGERAPNFLQKERFLAGLTLILREKVKCKFPRSFKEALTWARLKDRKLQFQRSWRDHSQAASRVTTLEQVHPSSPNGSGDPYLDRLQRVTKQLDSLSINLIHGLQPEQPVQQQAGGRGPHDEVPRRPPRREYQYHNYGEDEHGMYFCPYPRGYGNAPPRGPQQQVSPPRMRPPPMPMCEQQQQPQQHQTI